MRFVFPMPHSFEAQGNVLHVQKLLSLPAILGASGVLVLKTRQVGLFIWKANFYVYCFIKNGVYTCIKKCMFLKAVAL